MFNVGLRMSGTIRHRPSSGYTKSNKITIDHTKVPSNQTNFPMLFSGTYTQLRTILNGGFVQNSSGFDIIFSSTNSPDGSGILPFERVNYDPITGTVEFWVNVPLLSSTADTVIYLLYDNLAIVTDQSNAPGTWDANYVGVWHFGTSSSLLITDSTGNSIATNHGATPVTGKISGGANFVSSGNNWLDTGAIQTGLTSYTLEAWAAPTASAIDFLVSSRNVASTDGIFMLQQFSLVSVGYSNGPNFFYRQSTTPFTTSGTPYTQLVGTHAGGSANQVSLYVNGSPETGTTGNSGTLNDPANSGSTLQFGRDGDGATPFYYSGNLDEVRLSNIVRSADWIATGYNSQNAPSTFYTVT